MTLPHTNAGSGTRLHDTRSALFLRAAMRVTARIRSGPVEVCGE